MSHFLLRSIFVLIFFVVSNTVSFAQCQYQISDCGPRQFTTTQSPSSSCSPTSFTFEVIDMEGGGGGLSYQWYRKTGGTCEAIVGASGPSYSTPVISTAGQYECHVSIASFICYVFNFAPFIQTPPATPVPVDQQVEACDSGPSVLQVQYQFNHTYTWRQASTGYILTPGAYGTLPTGQGYLLNGSGNSVLTIYHSDQPQSLDFNVTSFVTGSCGNSTGTSLSLIVLGDPVVTISPSGQQKICANCSQQLTASAGAGYSFQWEKDGTLIPNAIGSTYQATEPGTYRAKAQAYNCSVGCSPTVVLTRNIAPTADAGPDHVHVPTSAFTLRGFGDDTDGDGLSFLWTKVSGPAFTLSNNVSPNLNLFGLPEGTYVFRLTVKDSFNDIATDDVNVTIVSPLNNYNYIRESSIEVAGISDVSAIPGLNEYQKNESYSYFDGLGRPMQSVQAEASPGKMDIVQPVVYDTLGREARKYLPFTSGQNGWYKPNEQIIDSIGNYVGPAQPFYAPNSNNKIADDARPFSETQFEPSPLNRPVREYGAGSQWAPSAGNKYVERQYLVNVFEAASANHEKIIAWRLNITGMPVRSSAIPDYITAEGYYTSGQLSINRSIDEQRNEVRTYTDRNGRVVLKKVRATDNAALNNRDAWAATYYIYDDLGNLRFVLQPELSRIVHQNDAYNPSASDLDRLAFQYQYDGYKRMTHKKVPGSEWIYMVYDKRDRLVLTQDGNQRKDADNNDKKEWTFTKYDALNRIVLTGIYTADSVLDQTHMQDRLDTYYAQPMPSGRAGFETYVGKVTGHIHGYDNKSFPVVTDASQCLTVMYYDTYAFRSLYSSTQFEFHSNDLPAQGDHPGQATEALPIVVGQVTGTVTRMLSTATWLKSVRYYDNKYRLIQQISDHPKGHEVVTNVYDFAGKVLCSKTSLYTGQPVLWINLVSAEVIGETIKGTHTTSWVAGASSLQTLSAESDGWVEFTVDKTTPSVAVGLNSDAEGQGYTNIDYCIAVVGGAYRVYEEGVQAGAFGFVYPGDVLRVERVNGKVYYKRNGLIVYTSLLGSTGALTVDASVQNLSAQFSRARVSNTFSNFAATPLYFAERFVYDHEGRMLETWHQLNGGSETLLAKNAFNELGQLVDKKLHSSNGNSFRQSVDYRYNIRGWLSRINNSDLAIEEGEPKDYFGMELAYNDDLGTGNANADPALDLRQYNGNISAVKWSTNMGLSDVNGMAYNFKYDALNRLKDATHMQSSSPGAWTLGQYDERDIEYDLNGNIKKLKRKGENASLIDDLVYNYTSAEGISNQLLTVTDNVTIPTDKAKGFYDGALSGDFSYDDNGNMIIDKNKAITSNILYNHLNLPEKVTRANSAINYLYDATGRKLGQVTAYGNVQKVSEYIGPWVFENNEAQFLQHDEGRVVLNSRKLVFSQDGTDLTSFTPTSNITLSLQTINGEEYVKVTPSNVALTKLGIASIGGNIPVSAGQRYVYRVKGYNNSIRTAYLYVKGNVSDIIWTGANLSSNSAADMWVETSFTIPNDVTQINVGVLYNTSQAGTVNDYFFIDEVELYRVEASAPEYQYHLKDHLGNVRLTFTTKPEEDVYTATFEDGTRSTEQATFRNYSWSTNDLFDHTDTGAAYDKALLLNGGNNYQVGLGKSFAVVPGDTVRAEVYAKYLGNTGASGNLTGFASALLSAFGLPAPAPGETGTASWALEEYGSFIASGENPGDPDSPKGWLNVLVFDKDYELIDASVQQLNETYVQIGSTKMPHQHLVGEVYIKEPGYVYIYVSNEGSVQQDIYFDDMTVTHKKSPVIQSDDYYPFGLAYNSYQRENSIQNRWKFQGQEHIYDLELGWDSFKWRNHQPEIGRFFNIDPLSEKYYYNSPYAFSENKVIAHVELEGLEAVGIEAIDVVNAMAPKPEPGVIEKTYSWLSSLITGDNARTLGDASDVTEVLTENSSKSTLKSVNKVTKFGGPLLDGTSIILDATQTDFDDPKQMNEFAQNTAQTLVEVATGPAAPATSIVIDNSKKEDGVTNVKNLQKSYRSTYNQQMNMVQQRIEYLRKSYSDGTGSQPQQSNGQ